MQSGSTPTVDDKYKDIVAPKAQDLSYQIQQLVEQGVITPEDAQAALSGRSELDNVSTDPKLREAQLAALSGLQDVSNGGLTDSDRASLSQISTDEATKSKGQRDAILQNAQSRGMGGSGLELMAQLQNEQDSASRKSARDTSVAGMAQQRALQALMDQGQLGGQIQAQDFNQQTQKANANDAISKFNAQNQQAANMANTQARNVAQASNLENKQSIANQNAALSTQQNKQKADVAQQVFNNSVAKAGGSQGATNFNAQAQGQNSQGAANANNQLIGAGLAAAATVASGGTAAPAAAALLAAQQKAGKADGGLIEGPPSNYDNVMTPTMSGEFVVRKEDVPDFLKKAHTNDDGEFDAAAFLDTITGHKYGYSKKGKKNV